MGMEDYSRYQQGIIKRFYENKETMGLQRVAELVGDLYLAEGKKRQKIWDQIVPALIKAGLPEAQANNLRQQDKADVLAETVARLDAKSPEPQSKPKPGSK